MTDDLPPSRSGGTEDNPLEPVPDSSRERRRQSSRVTPNALTGVSLSSFSADQLRSIKNGLRLTLWLDLSPDLDLDEDDVRDLLHRVETTLQEVGA